MMRFNGQVNTTRLLLGLVLMVSAGAAAAALGKSPSVLGPASVSPASPTAKMNAANTTPVSPLYTRHEVQLENGTLVREYTTSEGVVFAVSWQGPVLPDLSTLLGSYFSTFKLETERARQSGRRGGPAHIKRADLVVQSGGRMRHFFGHAYAPDLVPAGVDIKDVLQ